MHYYHLYLHQHTYIILINIYTSYIIIVNIYYICMFVAVKSKSEAQLIKISSLATEAQVTKQYLSTINICQYHHNHRHHHSHHHYHYDNLMYHHHHNHTHHPPNSYRIWSHQLKSATLSFNDFVRSNRQVKGITLLEQLS